jgi:predicted ABC-class ATPase
MKNDQLKTVTRALEIIVEMIDQINSKADLTDCKRMADAKALISQLNELGTEQTNQQEPTK